MPAVVGMNADQVTARIRGSNGWLVGEPAATEPGPGSETESPAPSGPAQALRREPFGSGLTRRRDRVLRQRKPGRSELLCGAALATLGAAFLLAGSVAGKSQDPPLLDRLLSIDAANPGLCPAAAAEQEVRTTVDSLALELRVNLAGVEAPADQVRALNKLLFERAGMRASSDPHDPCNLLLSGVVGSHQGYCVGLTALALVIAERSGLPLHAVATPSHMFVRYDDGSTRINIETTAGGAAKSDEIYIREGGIPEATLRARIFMHNLSADEFLAQVRNNLGVIYSERKDYAAAAREYQAALDLDRYLPAAWYNWGNDLLASGDYPGAAKAFTRSLRLFPTDVWALNNRGMADLKRGRIDKARRDFEAALQIDPAFDQAKKNLTGMTPATR